METSAVKDMKVLIIQTAYPGDAILTLPMIQEFKKQNQEVIIDVLCIPATKEIFDASPSVDSTIVIEKSGKHKNFFSFLRFVKDLSKIDYKKIYSPHRSFRSALIVWLLGVENTSGFSTSTIPYVYNNIITYDPLAHEVCRNLSLINFNVKDENWKILPELLVTELSMEKVNDFQKRNSLTDYISIAPGSVWNTKKYPLEYFKEIIQFFIQKNFKVLLIGGETDKGLCEQLTEMHSVVNAAGLFSFVETIGLLKSSKLLICNDSAPTHLGMCADIPVLTIYCSTVPDFGFYPYNSKSDYISYNDLKCKPCGIHGHYECPIGTFECAKQLLPEKVINKAITLLEKING